MLFGGAPGHFDLAPVKAARSVFRRDVDLEIHILIIFPESDGPVIGDGVGVIAMPGKRRRCSGDLAAVRETDVILSFFRDVQGCFQIIKQFLVRQRRYHDLPQITGDPVVIENHLDFNVDLPRCKALGDFTCHGDSCLVAGNPSYFDIDSLDAVTGFEIKFFRCLLRQHDLFDDQIGDLIDVARDVMASGKKQ